MDKLLQIAEAPDLPEYIMSSETVRVVLRKARKVATDKDWEEFLKKLDEKENSRQ